MNISIKPKVQVFLILDAIILALVAQQFLVRNKILLAIILFIVSVAVMILAVRTKSTATTQPDAPILPSPIFSSRLRLIFAIWAFLLSGFTFFIFESSVPAIFHWLIHFMSIVFFLAAVIKVKKPSKPDFRSLLPDHLGHILILAGIFLLGGILRFTQLDMIPFGTWYDEADFGLNALSILENPDILPVFFESSRVPAYFIYLCALSIKFLGASTTSLRIVSALFGTATILAAYLFGKYFFNPKSGLVFAAFIAFSRWHINWSRIGLDNITVPFFEILILLLLFLGLRRKNHGFFAFAGITLGLGLSFYASMRIFPVVIGLWLLLKWSQEKTFLQNYWHAGVIFMLAAFITLVPISQYAVFHPDRFWDRVKQTSIFQGKTNQEAVAAIAETTREHLFMFNYQGDHNGRHNYPGEPMLDPISAALMVLGLAISLSRIHKPTYFLVVVWWLVMLTPGIFSLDFESPQSLRAIGSMPAAYLLTLIPINELFLHTKKLSQGWLRISVHVLIVCGFLGIGIYNSNFYFNRQMQASAVWLEFSSSETIVAKEMNRIGPANYYVSTFLYNTPTLRFLAPQIDDYHRLETYDMFPLTPKNDEALVFFIDADREPFFNLAMQYFPNGNFKKIYDPNGILILYQIQISAEEIKNAQGLIASYHPGETISGEAILIQKETGFSFQWDQHVPLSRPYWVTWEGVLYLDSFGEYRFFNSHTETTNIRIDGQLIPWEETVILAKGNHPIKIEAQAREGNFFLEWQPPEMERQPLTAAHLFIPPITANGLLGEYTSGTDWSGTVIYAQIDPFINFYYHNQPVGRPYTVKWQGKIKIDPPGLYQFKMESRDGSTLTINNQLVINNNPPGNQVSGEIALESGFYPIEINYTDQSGYSHISLFWTPPDQEESLVPAEVLFYP